MENDVIRVRFAPSPTGYLHVGGLRTALYCYLYARKTGGKFILRIEDTDRSRYVEDAVQNLINSLKLVGLEYDEGPQIGGDYGPYIQSERTELYRSAANELLEKNAAYYCFCTPQELADQREKQLAAGENSSYSGNCRNLDKETIKKNLESGKEHVLRLKIPQEGELSFYDLVREKVTYPWQQIDDQIIIKSDGFPTYHLANVVDDHLMEISHVIRGEEWLPSTPKHIFIYQVLGWKTPKWVHLPLILNTDKSKLSKRQGDVAVEDFLAKGFLPEALLNFIALLGWHSSGDRELYSLKDLIKEFSLKRISKSGAVFDIEKLKWMNSHYLKHLALEIIAERAESFFLQEGFEIEDKDRFLQLINFARERVNTMAEMPHIAKPFLEKPKFDEPAVQILKRTESIEVLRFWQTHITDCSKVSESLVKDLIKKTTQELGCKGPDLYFPLRLSLFGSTHGPDLPQIIGILGKEKTLQRIKSSLDQIS